MNDVATPTRVTIAVHSLLGSTDANDPGAAGPLVDVCLQHLGQATPLTLDVSGTVSLTTAFLNALLVDVLPAVKALPRGTVRFKMATSLQQEMLQRSTEGVRRRLEQLPAAS